MIKRWVALGVLMSVFSLSWGQAVCDGKQGLSAYGKCARKELAVVDAQIMLNRDALISLLPAQENKNRAKVWFESFDTDSIARCKFYWGITVEQKNKANMEAGCLYAMRLNHLQEITSSISNMSKAFVQ
ncbi:hypothetical protein NB640_12470 [Oxalobacter vibrioformis]|uniref:Lysozyme inhibitor LprI N-terminal domain-containing protein n=1 Tax=Oxalobacter vibrioformis TaxID=933080 RepID=A0A9E9LYR7_9BURK|nr:hypothetical protein [Oxalobacter vibrioformis]WAW10012.1 hypothetical protein NB640_12470 [Oxalobacter vibrioformis]